MAIAIYPLNFYSNRIRVAVTLIITREKNLANTKIRGKYANASHTLKRYINVIIGHPLSVQLRFYF